MTRTKMFAAILTCTLLLCSCKLKRAETPYMMGDLTYNRILYTLETEKNRDAERYTTTVTMQEGIAYYQALASYYFTADEIKWDDYEYYYREDLIHSLMWGSVIPFKEADGTVNDYILYTIYDGDLARYFAFYCDKHPGEQTTITWHYDTRGNRVIDEYDVELAKPEHLKFWTMQNENHGVVPPIWEYDMGLTGELPTYSEGQGAIYTKDITAMYPDVKPYGIDYPVGE